MRNTRGNIAAAVLLIAIGVWFLSVQLFPNLQAFAFGRLTWPVAVIGAGVLIALIGLLTWVPAMLVPACIVGGIGGLLYWQNATGNWESWAYMWTLIPGFVGIGIFLSGLLNGDRKAMVGGGWTILNSLVLLAIFGTFLGGMTLWRYWPILLILLGVILMIQALFKRG